jgi:hypothetical protein
MQINWRLQLRALLGIAVAYVALNVVGVYFDMGTVPVNIAVSVLDANNSGPVSHAVASWQSLAPVDFDCEHTLNLLNESGKIRSSEGGVLSPGQGFGWELASVFHNLGAPDEGIPMHVIGMTTKNGRLEFRAYFRHNLNWIWPYLGHVDASCRRLQVDAMGYDSKQISLRKEDFSLVEGEYRVNVTVLLDPETAPR